MGREGGRRVECVDGKRKGEGEVGKGTGRGRVGGKKRVVGKREEGMEGEMGKDGG